MGQTWEQLLFAHWAVPVDAVRRVVPPALDLDTFDGSAWLGITPFRIAGLRLRGTLPPPGISSFLELNVRTYVTDGRKPGIWFFSLDAASRLAVEAARHYYDLPYHLARMRAERRGEWIRYESARISDEARPRVFSARYRPVGRGAESEPGSLEHFLVERYCLYALHSRGGLRRAEIHHRPWELRPAEASIELNTMAPDGIELPTGTAPLLHLAERQDVVIWSPADVVP